MAKDISILERAHKKYPVREVQIPDIDEGCPSWLTEDENAIKRSCYIKGATEQKDIERKRFKAFLQKIGRGEKWAAFERFMEE